MTIDDGQDDGWDRGWREHKIRQMVRLARLPFAEKLAWLEDAEAVVESLRNAGTLPPRREDLVDEP